MELARQEYWSGLLFTSPGYLPNQGIKPSSPTSQADSIPSEPPGKPQVAQLCLTLTLCDPMDYNFQAPLFMEFSS